MLHGDVGAVSASLAAHLCPAAYPEHTFACLGGRPAVLAPAASGVPAVSFGRVGTAPYGTATRSGGY